MKSEIPKTRTLKNIGVRPHNLPFSQLQMTTEDQGKKGQLGVLMLKPGCFSVEGRTTIQDNAEELMSNQNLDVISTSCVLLDRNQIHQLYPNIFGESVVASTGRLGDLRVLLEDYLSDCVFSYLVSGENTQQKLDSVKRVMRQQVEHVGNWDVHNHVHVPDSSDMPKNLDLLFNHPVCRVCSRHQNE